jgi:DNA-binding NarL/FixJ family response regulator
MSSNLKTMSEHHESLVKSPLQARFSVLVVDDSAIVRERLRVLLAEHESVRQVLEAASGADAWTLFQQHAPEVVLLDIYLPDRRGLEVLSRIKRAAPSCLVIVLTNLGDAVFRQETQRRGADHFLHKATEFERVDEFLRDYASLSIPPPLEGGPGFGSDGA